MSRIQREKPSASEAPATEWHPVEPSDCWAEMQAANAGQGHAAWASLASQRPAVEERLSRLVNAIEHDIIPRLVRAHAQPTGGAAADVSLPTRAEVLAFTGHVMDRDDAGIHAQLAGLRARGVSVESLYVGLLAPAARHLGELWDDDRCHFADVTVGMGRLQQIMRGLSTAFGTEIDPPAGGRRALLMPSPGDQHTFGLSMVAEFFARAGWEVVGVMDPLATGYEDRVKDEWFDLVGISAGSTMRLERHALVHFQGAAAFAQPHGRGDGRRAAVRHPSRTGGATGRGRRGHRRPACTRPGRAPARPSRQGVLRHCAIRQQESPA